MLQPLQTSATLNTTATSGSGNVLSNASQSSLTAAGVGDDPFTSAGSQSFNSLFGWQFLNNPFDAATTTTEPDFTGTTTNSVNLTAADAPTEGTPSTDDDAALSPDTGNVSLPEVAPFQYQNSFGTKGGGKLFSFDGFMSALGLMGFNYQREPLTLSNRGTIGSNTGYNTATSV